MKWYAVKEPLGGNTYELRAQDGRILATVYTTGSRMLTDKWAFSIKGQNTFGRASTLYGAKSYAESAVVRMGLRA